LTQLTFLGVGDATDPAGATTSVLYQGERTLLVDCGPAIASTAIRALADPDALDAVWITHQHADHCFGLPTLLLTLRLSNRKKPLDVLGGPGSAAAMSSLIELGYPGAFAADRCYPIRFTEVSPDRVMDWHGLQLATAQTQHSLPCYALRIDDGQHRVCISGDGKVTEATLGLYRDADLVVHECQFAERERWDHSRVADLPVLFTEARTRQLALVHSSIRERQAIADKAQTLLGSRAFMPETGDIFRFA
jgi:ribonuclease Z